MAGAPQTAAAPQSFSSSISRDEPRTEPGNRHDASAGSSLEKLGFLLKDSGDLPKMLMVTVALLFLGSLNVVSVSLSLFKKQPDGEVNLSLPAAVVWNAGRKGDDFRGQ